jgi:hypothetical protein
MDPFSARVLGIGGAILGGIGGQSQADAQNEAIERQYDYDRTAWRYGKKTTKADYKHNVKSSGGWINAMTKQSVRGKMQPIYRIGTIT